MGRRRKVHDIWGMPVSPKKCKTCPFQEDGCLEIRHAVMERCMTIGSQMCHGTDNKTLCRGARDHQVTMFHRLKVLKEPTDEAWSEAMGKLNKARSS